MPSGRSKAGLKRLLLGLLRVLQYLGLRGSSAGTTDREVHQGQSQESEWRHWRGRESRRGVGQRATRETGRFARCRRCHCRCHCRCPGRSRGWPPGRLCDDVTTRRRRKGARPLLFRFLARARHTLLVVCVCMCVRMYACMCVSVCVCLRCVLRCFFVWLFEGLVFVVVDG